MTFALELAGAAGVSVGTGAGAVWLERWRVRRRRRRSLANISRLELELGIVSAPVVTELVERPRRRPWYGSRVERSPYSFAAASRAAADSYLPTASTPGRAYEGPELTDADVRRLEHPQEFER